MQLSEKCSVRRRRWDVESPEKMCDQIATKNGSIYHVSEASE